MFVSPAKTTKPIEMPFGGWLGWAQGTDGVEIARGKGQFCGLNGELCQKGWTDLDAVFALTRVGPKNHVLDGVQIGRIHLQPWGVTIRRCGLLPYYFGRLLLSSSSSLSLRPTCANVIVSRRRWSFVAVTVLLARRVSPATCRWSVLVTLGHWNITK